ncbi:Crp/Fnr family transcriptional regulator [Olivibacter sp. CPCC 100613]|uniref:Crp/Fnr family transcriptional regulator n=1 Tax=Olivibacter sp. CPCC 100613 TaxID=3079931 RepID=UPI002FFA4C7C
MFQVLFSHIEEKVQLSDAEKAKITSYFRTKKIKRRGYILMEGDVCNFLTFVERGLLKSANMDEKGNEHISLFAWEGWWISDFNSFIHQVPAVLSIEAIEDSELLQISRDNYEKLLIEIPLMERYFRILYQNSLVTKDQRLISSNSDSAESKYLRLVESMPNILQRVPQNLIASYLGLAPETISRIKNKR